MLAQPGVLRVIQVWHGRQVQLDAEFQLRQPLGGVHRTRVGLRHQLAAHPFGQRRELVQPLLQRLSQPLHRRHEPPGIADQPRLRIIGIDVDLAPDMRQLRSLEIAAELDFIADELHIVRQRFDPAPGLRSGVVTAVLLPRLQNLCQIGTRWCFHRQHDGPLDSTASSLQEKFELAFLVHALGFDFRQVRTQTRPPVSEHGILKCVLLDQTGRATAAAIEHLPPCRGQLQVFIQPPGRLQFLVHDEADQIPIQLQQFRHLGQITHPGPQQTQDRRLEQVERRHLIRRDNRPHMHRPQHRDVRPLRRT